MFCSAERETDIWWRQKRLEIEKTCSVQMITSSTLHTINHVERNTKTEEGKKISVGINNPFSICGFSFSIVFVISLGKNRNIKNRNHLDGEASLEIITTKS